MANVFGAIGISMMLGAFFVIIAGLVSLLIILVHAFRRSATDGLLSLFVPFYIVYYMFSRFSHRRKGAVVGCALAGPALLAILGGLAVHGMRRFIANQKLAEARYALGRIAKSVCNHMESQSAHHPKDSNPVRSDPESLPERGASAIELPPTAPPVPSSQALVRGKRYQSVPGDWSGTWHTIGFSIPDPQRFQYEWERLSATRGIARATADLDGDGTTDARFELPVECELSKGELDCRAASSIVEVSAAAR